MSEGVGVDERVKKARTLTLKDYDDALDADVSFNVDLNLDLALDPPESPAKMWNALEIRLHERTAYPNILLTRVKNDQSTPRK